VARDRPDNSPASGPGSRYRQDMLAVERVALLRHVEMFRHTPGRVLAGLAHVLEEVEFPSGTPLMVAGAHEDWLFVLIEGEVEVYREDRRIRMGAGSVVGELGVLDPQARSATVTALTPVRAFRLRKAAFDEAVTLNPEIARGVILELVRRLREPHGSGPAS
jgi:CRP-like cAMP-binding protein